MSTNEVSNSHWMSNTTYDTLKRLAQIGLPALGTLYFTIAQIWGLPRSEEVVGTIVAIDAFLGILLGYSSRSYNNSDAKFDGVIAVKVEEDKKVFSLELNGDPDDLTDQSQVIFKVQSD
jgi:Putative phage holin Dp-1